MVFNGDKPSMFGIPSVRWPRPCCARKQERATNELINSQTAPSSHWFPWWILGPICFFSQTNRHPQGPQVQQIDQHTCQDARARWYCSAQGSTDCPSSVPRWAHPSTRPHLDTGNSQRPRGTRHVTSASNICGNAMENDLFMNDLHISHPDLVWFYIDFNARIAMP